MTETKETKETTGLVRRQQSSTSDEIRDAVTNAQTVVDLRNVEEGDGNREGAGLLQKNKPVADKGDEKKRSGPSLSFWQSSWKKTQSWKWRPKFLLYWLTSQGFLWFIFGVMWFCITIGTNTSGDVDVATKSPGNGTDNTTMPGNDTSSTAESQACMIGINPYDFWTATQFSFETQLGRKISAGKREVSEDCRGLSILVIIQSILGYLLNIFLLGVVFGKDESATDSLPTDAKSILQILQDGLNVLSGVPGQLRCIEENLNIASQREHEAQNTIGSIRELLTKEAGALKVLQRSIDAIFRAQGEMKEQGQQDSQGTQNSLDRLQANSESLVSLPGNVHEAKIQLDRLHKMLEEAQKESGGQNTVTESRLDDMQGQLGNLNRTVTNVVTNLNQMTGMVQRLLRNPIEVEEVEELHED